MEQHARPLAGVGTNIDNMAEFPNVAWSKKRETTLFGIEREPIAPE